MTFEQVELAGVESWLQGLQEELKEKRYRPQAVRRVIIPKAGGGEPPQKTISPLWSVCSSNSVRCLNTLGEQHLRRIPPAAANWLDENGSAPFEAANGTYAAYRLLPRLKLDEAVVDADLSKYFDMIPHDDLMRSIALRIVDRAVLSLLKSWLQAPVQGDGPQGPKSMSGGKQNKLGTPQGGVISPMLANRYMNRYLRYWRQCEGEKKFSAKLVNYADAQKGQACVILSKGKAQQALAWTRGAMTRLKLEINETKTCVKNARVEQFDFLGYRFGLHPFIRPIRRSGRYAAQVRFATGLKAANSIYAAYRLLPRIGLLRRVEELFSLRQCSQELPSNRSPCAYQST